MKKIFCICLLATIILSLSACADTNQNDGKITVVTTVFSEFDWVRQILGDANGAVDLILLTENGTDLHSYQPTVSDMATIASCDLLIYTGGTSDTWIDDALSAAPVAKRQVLRLMDLLSKDEKLTEQSHHHNTEHRHDEAYDEHIWLSVKNAVRFCSAICEVLCQMLPEYAEDYRSNCQSYTDQLKALDSAFATTVSSASVKTLLFADRFPFSYLTHDYGIHCYAAFPGCSSETEASFETVAYLAKTMDELSLPAVVILENSDQKMARTILAATESKAADIVVMDSLQSISHADLKNGVTYLDIMKANLSALKAALGE